MFVNIQVYYYSYYLVLCVVANKADLFIDATVSDEEGKNFAEKIGASFTNNSCLAGEGIKELFEEIQKKIMSDVVTLEVEKSDINRLLLDDGRHDKQKRNGCCGSNIKTPTKCQFCCFVTMYYCCCQCCDKEKKNSN